MYFEPTIGLTFNEPVANLTAGTFSLFDIITVGEAVSITDLLYQKSDGKWWKADADAAATMPGLRMALQAVGANAACNTLRMGRVRNDTWAWTVGGTIFASTVTGGLTQTAPSGTADIVQVVGFAYAATKMFFDPSNDTIEIL